MRTPSLFLALGLLLAISIPSNAAPILNPGNGNYYELVQSNLTWGQARSAAASMTFLGQSGHLANITTASEDAFLLTNFGTGVNASGAWIGGTSNFANQWFWADGPEAGIQFSTGQAPTAPFNYANWGGIEPNNPGGVAWFNLGNVFAGQIQPGTWADSGSGTPSGGDPAFAYIVEYETNLAQVPEPVSAMVWLVGSAALGIGFRRRRK